jgi:formamidopyrimidine-DNA glycosylase
MSSPPHPLMHFGMAGWFHIKGVSTLKYKSTLETTEWPPKYWKLILTTAAENGEPATEAAFVDFRRFARIRLIDCPATEMRQNSPLKENGPDPVIDRDILTEDWLAEKCAAKKIPIKALLLDQANISGIGNWVGDEIMYDAAIHPEQYSNTLSRVQVAQVYKSMCYVTSLAVDTLSDSSKFPETWLFKHRWGKGKKDASNKLPNGAGITFLTVGGRTSAVVPSVQKKTGPVAGDIKEVSEEDETPKTAAKANGGKKRKRDGSDDEVEAPKKSAKSPGGTKAKDRPKLEVKQEISGEYSKEGQVEKKSLRGRYKSSDAGGADNSTATARPSNGRMTKNSLGKTEKTTALKTEQEKSTTSVDDSNGRRRSKRVSEMKG